MKSFLKKASFLLIVICCTFSCEKEADVRSNSLSEKFIINTNSEIINFSNNVFILATSEESGETLYWDIGTSFEEVIEFENPNSETIDLTYGVEFERGFRITTYRGIESGFKLSDFIYRCNENEYGFDSLHQKSVEVIIDGTTELEEVINPLQNPNSLLETLTQENIIYDFEKNITRIRGKLGNSIDDLQFTFRFLGEENYKSIVIKRQDWIKVDNENYKKEIKLGDLVSSSFHDITVVEESGWIVDSKILTRNGRRIIISNWTNFQDTQHGNKIRIFLQDGLEIEELEIELESNNVKEGFHYHNKLNFIPESISLKVFDHEFLEINPEKFDLSVSKDYDLAMTTYGYNTENFISPWYIFQKSNAPLEYKLPKINPDFLENTQWMKNHLPRPDHFSIKTYSIDETDFGDRYQETGIERQLRCLKFNSSYEEIDL